MIFHIPTAAWKTLHSTPFHSEFSTVPTASTTRFISVANRQKNHESRRLPRWERIVTIAPQVEWYNEGAGRRRKTIAAPARGDFFLDDPFHRTTILRELVD